jgi:serine/threonine protein kinase
MLDGFTTGRTLGQGFSAKVKLATDAAGNSVALKIFNKSKDSYSPEFLKLCKTEVEKTKELDHPSLVKHYMVSEDATWVKKGGKEVKVAYIA